MVIHYRNLTSLEVKLLERMLHSGVEGYIQYLHEVNIGVVEVTANDNSLFFKTPEYEGPGYHVTISEAEYVDIDGQKVYLTVHIVHGRLHELEIYKEDGSLLKEPIKPEKVTIIWPDEKTTP